MTERTKKWRPNVPWVLLAAAMMASAAGAAFEFAAPAEEMFWLPRGAFAAIGAGAALIATGATWLMHAVLARRKTPAADADDAGDHA